MTQMIDGKALAAKLQGQLAEKTAKLKEETGLVPGLVVILVGDNPAKAFPSIICVMYFLFSNKYLLL